MSNPIKRPLVLMTVLVAGFVTSAQAQRGNHSFGRSGSSGNSNMGSRMEQHSAADRQPSTSFDRQPRQSAPSRQGGDVLRQEMPSTNQGSFSSGSTQRRNNNPGNFGSRQGQGTTPNNTQVYNNTNRNNN